jgi:lipopolysaccharide export system protein LptA
MDSVHDAAGRRRQLHGTSPTAELEFNAQGQLRHAHLKQGVAMDSQEQSEPSGQKLSLSRHWRSPVADVEFRNSDHGQIELSAVHGSGGVIITGESQRGQGAIVPSRLSADDVTGILGPHSVLTGLNGVGHASI